MAEFVVNKDVVTNTPTVQVSVTSAKPLPRGRQRFQLVVTDDSNVSQPDTVFVIVADTEAPTAVLTAPGTVASGRSFTLNGDRSFDAGAAR